MTLGSARGHAMVAARDLALDLDDRWRRDGRAPSRLPALAAAALREHALADRIEPEGILASILEADILPPQVDVQVEHPFTLFQNDRLSVEAFVWIDGSMDVHDHAFWGAFQVLSGASIHARYAFIEYERITAGMQRGELRLRAVEELRRGDVREILPGRELIHSLFHLARPSVTLLVASRNDPRFPSTQSYVRPGLAVDVVGGEARFAPRARALSVMHETASAEYPAAVARLVRGSGPDAAFQALLHAFRHLDGERFDEALDVARAAHGSLGELWALAFAQNRTQAHIVERRAAVTGADHRFFLAALLNAPDRAALLDLVERRFPARGALETIGTWLNELAAIPIAGDAGPTALGPALGEAELAVLDALLQGEGDDGVLAALARTFEVPNDDESRRDVLDLADAFRSSLLLAPLLASPPEPEVR